MGDNARHTSADDTWGDLQDEVPQVSGDIASAVGPLATHQPTKKSGDQGFEAKGSGSARPQKTQSPDNSKTNNSDSSCVPPPCEKPAPNYCGFTSPSCCVAPSGEEVCVDCCSEDSCSGRGDDEGGDASRDINPGERLEGADACYTQGTGGGGVCVKSDSCTSEGGLITDAECARKCFDGVGCFGDKTCSSKDLRVMKPAGYSSCVTDCSSREGSGSCFQQCNVQRTKCADGPSAGGSPPPTGRATRPPPSCTPPLDPPPYLDQIETYPPYPYLSDRSQDHRGGEMDVTNKWIIVDIHNALRTGVGYQDSSPRQYCWDARLQSIAKAHAEKVAHAATCEEKESITWVGSDGEAASQICGAASSADAKSCSAPGGTGNRCIDYQALSAYKAIMSSESGGIGWANVIGDVWAGGGCPNRDASASDERKRQYDAISRSSHDRVGCHMERFSLASCGHPDRDASVFFCAYDSGNQPDGSTICGGDEGSCSLQRDNSKPDAVEGGKRTSQQSLPADFCRQYVCSRDDVIIQ